MNTYWITTKEIAELAGCCLQKAREIKKEVHETIEGSGMKIPNRRKAPKELVLKYLGLEQK